MATPAAWSPVILWITAPAVFPEPTRDQASAGMAAFLDATAVSACAEDAAFASLVR